MKIIFYAIQITFLFSFASCFSEGLKRTPLDKLENQKFASLGISIDLPSKINNNYYLKLYDDNGYQKNSESKGALIIAMHPFASGTLSESNYILDLKIIRLTKSQFEDFINGKNLNLQMDEFKYFKNKLQGIQPTIVESSFQDRKGVFVIFRKDIPLANGDIVVAGAKLLHEVHNLNYESEDKEAIKKILNSIKSL